MKNILIPGLLLVIGFFNPLQGQKFSPQSTEEKVLYQVDCSASVLFIIKKDGMLALLDENQNPISDRQYDFIKILKKEMLYAKNGKTPILVNCEGKEVTSGQYKEITVFYNDDLDNRYFVTNQYGKIGLIDGEGNELLAPEYDSIDPMSQHKYLFAMKAGQKYFYDYNGNEIVR